MTTHTGMALRFVVPILAVVAPSITASCGSYDAYSSLQKSTDASAAGAGGGGGNEAGGGGTQSGGAGLSPVSSGGGQHDAGVHDDAEGSLPDSGAGDAHDAGRGDARGMSGRDANDASDANDAGDADAGTESSTPPRPPLGDIFDGGTLKPLPTVSSCGSHTEVVNSVQHFIVDFGCPDVLQDFHFVDPGFIVKGDWRYEPTGDPHLSQLADPVSYPAIGLVAIVSGSKALYMPKVIHDGMVSVRTWSTDDDDACIVMRYQDELHYYRTCLFFQGAGTQGFFQLVRITGTEVISFGTNGIYKFSSGTAHQSPGHVIAVEFVGQSFRASLDGTQVFAADDPGGYSFGRVGIEDILLRDAHFDDFTVVEY